MNTTTTQKRLVKLEKIVANLKQEVDMLIPTESLDEYEQPEQIRASLKRALADIKEGRVITRL